MKHLGAHALMYGVDGDGVGLGAQVPEFDVHVVARQDEAPVPAEPKVADAADDLREEAPLALP